MQNLMLSAFLLFAFSFVVSAQSSPETTIKNFYSYYVGAIEANKFPLKDDSVKLKRFITLRLYNEQRKKYDANEFDADYFLQAQDFDKNWAKNVTVSDVKKSPNKTTANVLLKGKDDFDQKLKLSLVNEKGKWKIDKIQWIQAKA
ncbi:MAG: DUF3828 domain-containing protein [Pyrinomonadaceae bacterium]|nr:DUF3828 domain-containing protein [Pyrinomonadaceae bacterium]